MPSTRYLDVDRTGIAAAAIDALASVGLPTVTDHNRPAAIGAVRSDADTEEPAAVPRDDGSWLLAGWMPADEMADQLGITLPPRREYQTVAGFVLAHLRRLPAPG